MKATEKLVSKAIQRIVSSEEYGWPPDCWGPFYQPERPVSNRESHDAAENRTTSTTDE